MAIHFAGEEHVTLEDGLAGGVELDLEFVDVGVQSAGHHFRGAGEAQPRQQGSRNLLAVIGIAAGRRPGDIMEHFVGPADAVPDRARELVGE